MAPTNVTLDLLSRKQAAAYLTISTWTLDRLDIPKFHVGRKVVYRKADIDAWLESRKAAGRAQA